jgi:hypothetical protein
MQNPVAQVRELGGDWPADVNLRVVENTATHRHLILPAVPATGPVGDDELATIAGGIDPIGGTILVTSALLLSIGLVGGALGGVLLGRAATGKL